MLKTILLISIILISLLNVNAQTKEEIIIGTGEIINHGYPIYPAFDYTYSQTIYLQSELGGADVISKIWYNFGGSSLDNSNDWTIYMGHTTKNQYDNNNDWIDVNTLTEVYSNTFVPTNETGWIEFDITDFNYNGTDNLVIAVDENSEDNDPYEDNRFFCTSVANKRSIMDRSDSQNFDPENPPDNAFFYEIIPNIKLFKGTYPSSDIEISEIISPIGFSWKWNAGLEDVIVKIENKGTANLTEATINWEINNVAQTPFAWTGNLAQNTSETVTIGTYNFQDVNSYNIYIEGITANDGNPANNSVADVYEVINSFATNYSENFDTFEYPNTPKFWTVETNVVAWIVDDRISHSDENSVRTFFNEDFAKDDWIFSPYMNLVGGSNYAIKFWLHALGWGGVGESLELNVGNNTNSTSMTSVIWSDNNINTSNAENENWIEISLNYTPPTNGNYVFGWHANSVANLNDIAIDDFSINGQTATLHEKNNEIISIYPNPTKGNVNIISSNNYNLKIYNSIGQFISEKKLIKSNLITIKNKGVYFLHFSNSEGIIVKKIVVE